MCDWVEYKLGEIATFSYGVMPKKELLFQGSYPTFSGYKYQFRYPFYNCDKGDIIVVARGVGGTGDVKIVKELCFLTNLSIKIAFDKRYVNNSYFYYGFLNNGLRHLDSGSAQSQITIKDLSALVLEFPPLAEQERIAGVLGALDDKIELLRSQNKTLEEMAQAIFKCWFVDFDIVKAKQAGTPKEEIIDTYKISPELYDLFPSTFTDSPLGPIPTGWEVKPLSQIAVFLNGLALQKYPPQGEDDCQPILKIAELRNGFSLNTGKASKAIPDKYIVSRGDVIFSWSGSLLVKIWGGDDCALNQHLFKVTSEEYPKWFYYFWVLEYLPHFQHIAEAKAVTMGHIQRHHLDEAQVLVSDYLLIEGLTLTMQPFLNKVDNNQAQIKTLTEMRDALLPKLISGKIRV